MERGEYNPRCLLQNCTTQARYNKNQYGRVNDLLVAPGAKVSQILDRLQEFEKCQKQFSEAE